MWVCELSSETRLAETACVGCEALWAEVCVGGSTVLSQPVWHRELPLSFTVAASFCQHSVCRALLLQPLSLRKKGELAIKRS